jgi:hypothetical protein
MLKVMAAGISGRAVPGKHQGYENSSLASFFADDFLDCMIKAPDKVVDPLIPVDQIAKRAVQPLPIFIAGYRLRGEASGGCVSGGSRRDLAPAIGIPLNLMPANPAGKCLQFEIVAVCRMRRASR